MNTQNTLKSMAIAALYAVASANSAEAQTSILPAAVSAPTNLKIVSVADLVRDAVSKNAPGITNIAFAGKEGDNFVYTMSDDSKIGLRVGYSPSEKTLSSHGYSVSITNVPAGFFNDMNFVSKTEAKILTPAAASHGYQAFDQPGNLTNRTYVVGVGKDPAAPTLSFAVIPGENAIGQLDQATGYVADKLTPTLRADGKREHVDTYLTVKSVIKNTRKSQH
jgi:hypothetical protein